MSGCIQIIYGSVLPLNAMTPELETRCDEWYGTDHMQVTYSGNGKSVWWAGVNVCTLFQYSWPESGYEVHTFEPTKKQRQDAAEAVRRIPEILRKHMTPIGRYVLPCP